MGLGKSSTIQFCRYLKCSNPKGPRLGMWKPGSNPSSAAQLACEGSLYSRPVSSAVRWAKYSLHHRTVGYLRLDEYNIPDTGQTPSKCYFLSFCASWNITTFQVLRRLSSEKQRNLFILSGINSESLNFGGKLLDMRGSWPCSCGFLWLQLLLWALCLY